jgi:curved DNA-binding protein CbpA
MAQINYYEILEVYPAATQEEIEAAYRMLLYKYHPDHNPEKQEWAHKMTANVVDAYQCLSNPERRKIHNFQIYCNVRRLPEERKFFFFQGKQKKAWETALALFKAGVALYDRQKSKAMEKFHEATTHWPQFPEAFYNIGLCQVDMKRYDEARSTFNKIRKMKPPLPEVERTLRRLMEVIQSKNVKL